MKYFRSFKSLLLSALLLIFLSSCSSEIGSESFENSLVSVKLKGTPSQFSAVNIEVLDIQFRVMEDETDPNAWISLNTINTGVHDLTSLAQDHVMPLVNYEEMPSEFVYNIKLVLGEQNTATHNGIEHFLDITSEYQNASSNIIEKQLHKNTLYEFTIEFEIDNSVVLISNGNANLNPKINTVMRRMELF